MDMKQKVIKKTTLFNLFFISVALILLVSLMTLFFMLKHKYLAYQNDLLDTSVTQINQTIIEKTTQYLMPATMLVESSARLYQRSVIDLNDTIAFENYLFSQLLTYPQLSKFYYGNKSGGFYMVYRNDDNSISSKYIGPDLSKARIKHFNKLDQLLTSAFQKTIMIRV